VFSQRNGAAKIDLTLPNGQRTTFYFNLVQQGTLGNTFRLGLQLGRTATLAPQVV